MNNEKELRHRYGWTPAPTKPAYSQTNVSLAHKGRDYDAILRAAKREPVGYWEDAPRGIKFGGGGNTEKASGLTKAQAPDTTQNATAPTTTPPPQQSADSPWPKWLIADTYIRRFDGPMGGCVCYHRSGRAHPDPVGGWDLWSDDPRVCSRAEAVQWLEQNGHEDAVAQLLGKDATGGGRVWKDKYNGWHGVWLNGRSFGKSATRASFEDIAGRRDLSKDASGYEVELFGPERDAILAECRKAMGL